MVDGQSPNQYGGMKTLYKKYGMDDLVEITNILNWKDF